MGEKEIEIDVPDYEDVEEEYEEPVFKTIAVTDDEGFTDGLYRLNIDDTFL